MLPDGTLLAGTTNAGVYVSRTAGATWAPVTTGLPPNSDVYAFLALPERGQVLAALISGGIYASQDAGTTWTKSDQGLGSAAGVNVFSLLSIPGQGNAIPGHLGRHQPRPLRQPR